MVLMAQPQENGNPEGMDDDELLIPLEVHSAPEDGSPREWHTSVALPGNEAVLVRA
jgi:hypothetical protein